MTVPPRHPLHLYRALLRECTYLPDPSARKYFYNYVISSFRSHLPKGKAWQTDTPLKRQVKAWRKHVPVERQVQLLDRGRQTLSLLQRANEGYLKPLEKVLMITYGRAGKRRQELVDTLISGDIPQDRKAVEALKTASPMFTKEWKPPAILETLLRSQAAHHGHLERANARAKPKPNIPEKTIWGKDLPESRFKNATKKWYARQLQLLYPPLPEKEWMELRALANGIVRWKGPIPRRMRGQGSDTTQESVQMPKVLLEGPQKGETFQRYVNGRPHQLTHRLMRRVWAVVFKHTPLIKKDPTKDSVAVHWEEAETSCPQVGLASSQHARILFEN